jgi:pilus assembly protein CpaE
MTDRVVLGIADEALAAEAVALVDESAQLAVAATARSASAVLDAVAAPDVDVVLLHERLGPVSVLDLAREVGLRHPHLGVVLAVDDGRPEMLRSALQSGARGVVSLPLSLDELEATLGGAAAWARAVRQRASGEITDGADGLGGLMVGVAGAKGGVGVTTIAVHLALASARSVPRRSTCLVDFDLQGGDVPSLLDITHHRGVIDLLDVANDLTNRHLEESLYVHRSGLRVLLAPDEGERGEEVDGRAARGILGGIKSRFDVVVVDCGSVVTDANAVAAELADHLLLVTTPDVPALRAANRALGMWRRLEIRGPEQVTVVVNRASRKAEVQPALARRVVPAPLADTVIPAGFRDLEAATNAGDPERLRNGGVQRAVLKLGEEVSLLPQAPRRLSRQAGQATIELLGVFPLLLLGVLACWQLLLAGFTSTAAQDAARTGSRAAALGRGDGAAAAVAALPSWLRDHAAATIGADGRVTLRVRAPIVVPGLSSSSLTVTRSAQLPAE